MVQKQYASEGFWGTSGDVSAKLKENAKPWKEQQQFMKMLQAVQDTLTIHRYRGLAICEHCKQQLTSGDYTLHGWKWNAGLMHYVDRHNYKPSKEFRRFIAEEAGKIVDLIVKAKKSKKAPPSGKRLDALLSHGEAYCVTLTGDGVGHKDLGFIDNKLDLEEAIVAYAFRNKLDQVRVHLDVNMFMHNPESHVYDVTTPKVHYRLHAPKITA